jgi:restriction system protein
MADIPEQSCAYEEAMNRTLDENCDRHGPGAEVARLLTHSDSDVRALASRLAGKLDLAFLRPVLENLTRDPVEQVRVQAAWALDRLQPNGGRASAILQTHGGYLGLKAHQAAEIAYDATVVFCNRLIDRRSRTHDQMVQAARSGKQNIVEGSAAAGTSSKMELTLIGVARASLEELLADYKDFLRQRGMSQWTKEDPRAQEVRKLAYTENRTYSLYRTYFEESPPEVAANTAICLVCQATYLLDRLKKSLEQTFLERGGIAERMLQARLARRGETGL